MPEPAASYPLIGRRPDEAVFRLRDAAMTAGTFLETARRIADGLPAGPFVVNLCRDRLWFAVALIAAMLRQQVTLLTSDRSAEQLAALAEQFPGAYAVAEEPVATKPLHQHLLPRDAVAGRQQRWADIDVAASQLAAIVFTSGTTGTPLAHRKPWGSLVERSIDAAAWLELPDASTTSIVGMVPPHHMYGFETTVLLPFHAAAATWCGAAFYPQDIVAALSAVPEPRVLVTTPLQIRTLLHASVDLPPIERIVSATAPLFPEMAKAAEERWGTRVFEIFGATEVGSIAGRRTVAGDVWTTYPRVRLSPMNEADASPDTLVSGPHADDFPLSDVVERLDDQHFRLIGRRSDVVKLGGRRASLAELNRILAGLDGVIDGQFVAPADLDRQPTARLLVFVVAPERSAEDLLAELRNRIDPLFVPRRVIKVDTLPRNDVGKLTDQGLSALRARLSEA